MHVHRETDRATLIELLQRRAAEHSAQVLYTFLEEGEGEESSLTYGGLEQRARRIAASLQAVVASGERAILLYPPGLEYVAGFFGCLYSGLVAVPAYPPDPARLDRTLPRLRAIIEDARAKVVLTTSFIASMAEFMSEQAPEFKALRWVATDELAPGLEDTWRPPAVAPDGLAFLQYTSGSTGTPKGVMLSHANLLHNLKLISGAFGASERSVGVIWLPPYHDMGLIGGILEPLYVGFPVTLLSPLTFLKRPLRWLEAISRTRGTISGGPNFAFDLCVRRITPEDRQRLDLSSWEVAFCGAEPIRPETLARFTEAFGRCGFRREAFYPCYGLAEGTLIVSGGQRGQGPRLWAVDAAALERNQVMERPTAQPGARTLVGCGGTLPDQEILIVDPESLARCPPGRVGEIWVAGPSVAQGYWQRPEETERSFRARPSDGGQGTFLRTGDLGFLQGGELFVAGRSKDLIIIRGRNHYPQDLELTAEQSHPALRPGCVAAFSVEVEGEERLVLVQEIDVRKAGDLRKQLELCEAVAGAIRQRLSEVHEVQLHALALIEPGSIPKTSSGKIQRHACRSAFLAGELRTVLLWREGGPGGGSPGGGGGAGRGEPAAPEAPAREEASATPSTARAMEAWLSSRLSARLRVPRGELDPARPITHHGLDSLSAVELAQELEAGLGVPLPMEALLRGPSIVELARQLLAAKEGGQGAAPRGAIQHLAREGAFELSSAQLRLWFLDQLEPGSPVYNIPVAVRLEGPLDVPVLERCFDEISRRHEALRTAFRAGEHGPLQVVAPASAVTLAVVELRALPGTAREEEVRRLSIEEGRRPFVLSEGPLWRARLLRLGEREHVLLLTMHHIVSDGSSMGVLVRELAALYGAFSAGQPSPLPALPIQYADYVRWQRGALEGDALEAQLAWWRGQLEGAPAALELPTDHPRPPSQTYRGATVPVVLSRELSEALKAMGQREGATLFMTLLAGFQAVLYRYTGQGDVSVGSPIAGRSRPELQGLIGFFANTLTLRTRLAGDVPFRELLGRVREVTLGAYAHQDVPFEKLVEVLQPVRSLDRSPLFQVMFVLQQDVLPELKLEGLALQPLPVDNGTAKFELNLSLTDTARGIEGTLEYNTDLFEAATAARLAGHLEALLTGAVGHPGWAISRLPLLTGAERHQLLVEWNAARAGLPAEVGLHHLFERQVARTPEAVAVVFEGRQLTYRELDRRANQLAHWLRKRGVGLETRVGLCVQRSLDMVVGQLGILKAGAAYVPLDPTYPRERLAIMLEDARVPVLVTQAGLLEAFGEGVAAICLDRDGELLSRESAESPAVPMEGGHLAYVIYTSGSTGRPKGVACSHAGAANLLREYTGRWPVPPGSPCSVWTSESFDVSVLEVFSTLSEGGALHLVGDAVRGDGKAFVDWMFAQRIRSAYVPPFMLPELLERLRRPGSACALERLLVGVEPIPERLLKAIVEHAPGLQLINGYGPTEATVCATFYPVHRGGEGRQVTPIGRPLANTQVYLLGEGLQPVPVGVPGELYIGGLGLARGYLDQPELTAERFIPDPFSEVPGARLYRTMDLARYLPDGNIQFLGRADQQVKLRGFRIEPGEIEAALRQSPEVQEAAVVVREVAPGDKRLVAYVVPQPGRAPEAGGLRAFLKGKLPEHMVPSAFVRLEALPLTPSGKLDRRALPAPVGPRPEAGAGFVGPRTPTEEAVAAIWVRVLHLEKVGIHDSFFELGGHSLLATQVMSRLREAFRVELPLRTMFERPTVAELAGELEAAARAGQAPSIPAPCRMPHEGPVPLSFAQQRLWFLDQLEPGNPQYNVAGMARLQGSLDVPVLERCFSEIVRRHEALRTCFTAGPRGPVQVVSPAAAQRLDVVDLEGLPSPAREEEVRRLAAEEGLRPFELSRGPLLRTTLLRLGEREHVLLLTMHHIASDGWSMGILVREVAALYEAFSRGRPSPLPEPPLQYADYALWQRSWLQGEALERQLSYWRNQLVGAPRSLELPTDRPRPAVQGIRGAGQPVRLGGELSAALKALGRQEDVTPFMLLLTAFQVLLHRYSGQDDLSVGSPIAGRRWVEVEGLIGFFLNTLVLRARLSPEMTFREALRQVKQVTLEAQAHQEAPFEKLVEVLQPERDPSRTPLFQVWFVLNEALPVLELPGLKLRPQEPEVRVSQFDLILALSEEAHGFEGVLKYSTDLFDPATAARMAGHLETLLAGVVANPGASLFALPLLTGAERRQVLVEWNRTRVEFPKASCAHHLFERQVELRPDAIAASFEGQTLTYRELNRRANQLAHALRRRGVGPETLVCLLVERSLDQPIGMLGILKAGGAFVTMDPTLPEDRLEFIAEDTWAPVLVTQRRLLDTLNLTHRAAYVLCLDEDREEIERESGDDVDSGVGEDNLAYIIYTSGSTGKPKGTLLVHRGLVNTAQASILAHGIRPDHRMLQFASPSFDAVVGESSYALLSGAQLCLAPREALVPGAPLTELMVKQGISVAALTPSVLALLDPEKLPALDTLISMGEACTPELARRWGRGRTMLNGYGPTEVTIGATVTGPVDPDRLTIGRPWANTRVYVLDERLQPVPVGMPGELYIDGPGLARGYLNRPELTAERFIPDPFSGDAGARLYRTGDRVRYLPDGELEFLGRNDSQVKLRGYRIELGEVEGALRRHPELREVAVAVQEIAGEKALVAYGVPAEGRTLGIESLRQFLKDKLPAYMMPAALVLLERLPLSPSGKVDRGALPVPSAERPRLETAFAAPRTLHEELLASTLADVLGLESVGIDDSFFELGGDSIRSIQVVTRARERGLEFTVADLLQHQTIRGLAEVIRRREGGASEEGNDAPFALLAAADRERLPADVENAYPLATLQAGMLFQSEYSRGAALYHDAVSFHLEAELDVSAFEEVLRQIIARHPILRTSFELSGYSEPLQEVHRTAEPPLRVEELRHLSRAEQDALLEPWLEEERRRPFDWARPPLLRFTLHRRTDETFQLTVVSHHAVLDGWSGALLFTELFERYMARLRGEVWAVEPPAAVFQQFVALERQALQSEASARYWSGQLDGVTPASRWGGGRRQEAGGQPALEVHRLRIPAGIRQGLVQLAHSVGVPLKTIMLAAHLRVLGMVEGTTDVLSGVTSHGRPEVRDGERILGLFLNTLPFRLALTGGTWRELVQAVFSREREQAPHRRYPLARLQQQLGGQPLLETTFDLTYFHVAEGLKRMEGLRLVEPQKEVAWLEIPLSALVNVEPLTNELELALLRVGRDEDGVESARLGAYYLTALEAIAHRPDERYETGPLLPEEERRRVLVEWNDTRADLPASPCLPPLFEARVARAPDAPAIAFEDVVLTYRELNRRANRLAHYLRGLGVGPEVRVALCMDRSPEMVVGMLGILKAGGAFVPLDPSYPRERLAFMLGDAAAPVLVTREALADELPSLGEQVVCLDAEGEGLSRQPEDDPTLEVTPDNLSYVIYTSGSTGLPKGTLLAHRGLCNTALAAVEAHGFRPDSRVLQFASYSFDASICEIFSTLLAGACLVLAPREQLLPDAPLLGLLERQRVTAATLTPSVLAQLSPEGLPHLETIISAGEALAPEVARRWTQGGRTLLNAYGPTEVTVCATITRGSVSPERVTIGRPWANVQVYVLDSGMQPVPIGAPGELYVGGVGLARGYLNRPELTAERFVPHPFRGVPGARLYRTGDRVRLLSDGQLQYLGRVDAQVKVRGFRIELGEVEAALEKHPAVAAAVVVVREDDPGLKRLVGYAVPHPGQALDMGALRRFLAERLPEYMVPPLLVALEQLPLTANGKVDRRALPAPDGARPELKSSFVEPRTGVERQLAAVWAAVLRLERVGIQDDFFELGGDSIISLQLIARARQEGLHFSSTDLFEHRTIAALASRVTVSREAPGEVGGSAPLTPRQRASSEREWLRLDEAGLDRIFQQVPDLEDLYPLSPTQQGMLFHALLTPTSGIYFEQLHWSTHSPLDREAFRRAWEAVVAHNPVLRTGFLWEGLPTPLQAVRPEVELPWRELDWSQLAPGEQQARFEAFLEEDRALGFELSRAPLMRLAVMRLGGGVHRFVWSVHHLLLDGWSIGLLFGELFAFYEAFGKGRELRLEPRPAYRDYIAWLQRQDLAAAERYWRKLLEGFTAPTPLPGDRSPGRAVDGAQAQGEAKLTLSGEATAALRSFARRHQLTLNTLLQGAWALLLSRSCGEEDVVFGSTVAGRSPDLLPGVESMMGLFINSLPVRVRGEGADALVPWLQQLQARQLEQRRYEYSPLVQVQGWSSVPRGTTLFESLLVVENYPVDVSLREQARGLDVRGLEMTGRTHYPLMPTAQPGEQLVLQLAFDTVRFEAATAGRLLAQWRTVMEAMAARPGQRLSEMSLLTEAERRQVLVEWNDTRVDFPPGECLHRLFEAQVARTPESIAVSFGETRLTYRELNRRANQLAHHLGACGVGPEVRVALFLERSVEMVVGLLGVLKAGGAYVPVDPDYPAERVAFMVEDSRAPVLLTQQRLVERLPRSAATVLCLDSGWEEGRGLSGEDPGVAVTPEHLAYVIYTSGSTGRPKGAMNAHGAVYNRLQWMQRAYGLGAEDRVLQKTPFSFDVSVWEFFWPLMTGARLVVAKPGGHRDGAYLVQLIQQEAITTLHFVPSMLAAFLVEEGVEGCRSLRRVICSGEALPAEVARQYLSRLGAELHNLYGPTEAAVDVTAWHCRRGGDWRSVPIGRPIANTRIHLLDASLQPVPVDVPGELYIGGVQVGRGYLGRPELTAERFIPDPFSPMPGARLYRTGDLARYLANGDIEYLGRVDFQVKVRGFRIELGEIEAQLDQHPSVRQSVVVVREDAPGDRRLVAYVVGEARELGVEALRGFLKERLPEYMVPALFVALESLPLTPSGKVDRKALPAPEGARPELEKPFVAPRTEVERKLAAVWAEVLRLERVGIHDGFFELGGDSIIGLQLVARARQAGLQLTPGQIFQHPTIARLAPVVSAVRLVQSEQGVVSGPVPLTPIQQWFFEQAPADPHHFNQFLILEVREAVDGALLEQALQHLVEHHDALRMRFVQTASGWEQVNARVERTVSLQRVELSSLPEAEQSAGLERVAAGLQASLDLAEGLLLRAALFDRGAGRTGRLLLVVHHLVVDGVSWRTLLEDLGTAYAQLRRGQKVALPPKTTSFKAWAERLGAYARSPALEQELGYWLGRSGQDLAPLPRNRSGGPNTVASARTLSVSLDAEETRLLVQELPTAYRAHINDVLLTALAQAFVLWTGQTRLRVDLEGHGREELFEDVELSRTVGWFTTIFPVLLELSVEASPGDALRAIRDELRQLPARGIGHGLLRYLGREEVARQLRALPPAEVVFNYLGQLDVGASGASPFGLVREPGGSELSPLGLRRHPISVSGFVQGGRLELAWTYSENLHDRATIESLARACASALRTLIQNRSSPDAARYTPSDFPLARLDRAGLDRVLRLDPHLEELYPLSPMQQGLLFHTLLAPSSAAYSQQFCWTVHAAFDVPAFRKAWEAVVAHNPILRTAFLWEGLPAPLQVVRPRVELPWQELDWRGLSAGEQQARFDAFLKEDCDRGFELSRAPLLRLAVIRLGEREYGVVWSMHHLLLDGWSTGLLLKELFTAYEAFTKGHAPRLEPGPVYRDYIAWLQRQDPSRAEGYWRKALGGFTAPTPLPGGRASGRAVDGEQAPRVRELALSADGTAALQAFVQRHQLTLNTLIQGIWALLLSRYSGERDVVFGATTAGRPPELPGIESMMGLFINSLPVRVRVQDEETLVPWLQGIQAQQLEQRQYEYTPLVQVQGWSDVPRGASLFESLLVFENYPVDSALSGQASGLDIRGFRAVERHNYPLSAIVVPARELRVKLSHQPARVDAETIDRMLGHLRVLLEGVVARPGERLAKLPLLTEEEREQLLVGWNQTSRDYPGERCVHALFEEQAARTPEAVAVSFEGKALTYGELDRRANQLAHHLVKRGVGPEVRVGLCVERSVELVVGMLGILKAGGAYVPMDLAYPKERLAFMVKDARLPVVVTQAALTGMLEPQGAAVVRLDADAQALAQEPTGSPGVAVCAENLAYVIYTSGSTGLPKGVCIPHRAILRLLINTDFIELTAADRVAQASNASFDAATFEVWGALLHGARLVGVGREVMLSPGALAKVIREEQVSVLFVTTALFNQVASEAPEAFAPLRQLHFGGEAVDARWVREVLGKAPPKKLLHVYGPTESTTFASWHEVRSVPEGATNIPIGRPLANTGLYLLDRQLEPVPVGVAGEVFIGGDGLAVGYLDRPELTAERFIPNPYGREPGARLYRTGDLARFREDGAIEFLGRVDNQVKLRGFRIELGEVEAALRQHASVREAVAMVREDVPGDRRLVAYVVAQEGQQAQAGALRETLKQRLPEYMVPSNVVLLEALPLNPNGKVDLKVLPAPDGARPELLQAFVAPRTDLERELCAIWAEILQVKSVGIHDNFFELGGHSLLATQALSRIRSTYEIEIPLRDLFEATTVERLALRILQLQAERLDLGRLEELMAELDQTPGDKASNE